MGGTAYVFGTKAGRDRYEQIRGWASSMKDRFADPVVDTYGSRHRTEGEPAHGERQPAEESPRGPDIGGGSRHRRRDPLGVRGRAELVRFASPRSPEH